MTMNSPADFTLAVHVGPGHTYEGSTVLLARAHGDGTLELLTAAWTKLLGYGRQELRSKRLSQLMGSRRTAALAVAAILDERNAGPVHLHVRCRNGRDKRLRLHRRFEPDGRFVYLVAEEAPGGTT